jgi:hypothetical protein
LRKNINRARGEFLMQIRNVVRAMEEEFDAIQGSLSGK